MMKLELSIRAGSDNDKTNKRHIYKLNKALQAML